MSRNNGPKSEEEQILERMLKDRKRLEELKKVEELEKLDSVIEKAQVESKELKRIEEKRIANVKRTERLVERFKSRETVVKNPFTEEGLDQLEDGFKTFKEEFYSKGIQEEYLFESDLELRGELLSKIEVNKSELDDYWSDIEMMANSRTDSAKKVLEELKARAVVLEENLEVLTNELKTQEERMMEESFSYYTMDAKPDFNNFERNIEVMKEYSKEEPKQIKMDEKINWVKNISEEAKANLDVKEAKVKEDIAKEAKANLIAIATKKAKDLIIGIFGDIELAEPDKEEIKQTIEENVESKLESEPVSLEEAETEAVVDTEVTEKRINAEDELVEEANVAVVENSDEALEEVQVEEANNEPEKKNIEKEEYKYSSVFDENLKIPESVFRKIKVESSSKITPIFSGALNYKEQLNGAFMNFRKEVLIPMLVHSRRKLIESQLAMKNDMPEVINEPKVKKSILDKGIGALEKLKLIEEDNQAENAEDTVNNESNEVKTEKSAVKQAISGVISLFGRKNKETTVKAEEVTSENENAFDTEITVVEDVQKIEEKVEKIKNEEPKIIVNNHNKVISFYDLKEYKSVIYVDTSDISKQFNSSKRDRSVIGAKIEIQEEGNETKQLEGMLSAEVTNFSKDKIDDILRIKEDISTEEKNKLLEERLNDEYIKGILKYSYFKDGEEERARFLDITSVKVVGDVVGKIESFSVEETIGEEEAE
ncbi:MAG: hypothetical protein N4A47_06140 [Clostridia bacterium]|jgi:hypothetical protein|nr:hypothetical protein [Clostridia bacterium]